MKNKKISFNFILWEYTDHFLTHIVVSTENNRISVESWKILVMIVISRGCLSLSLSLSVSLHESFKLASLLLRCFINNYLVPGRCCEETKTGVGQAGEAYTGGPSLWK